MMYEIMLSDEAARHLGDSRGRNEKEEMQFTGFCNILSTR